VSGFDEPSAVDSRRDARERALELLYEAEVKGASGADVLAGLPVPPAGLAAELVVGVDAHAERIDQILTDRVAPRWTLARLAALDRAVLRLATYELLDQPDRSQAVILNEAVVLARRFGTDDSPRFVNGVLSAVAAEVRGAADPGARDLPDDRDIDPADPDVPADPDIDPDVPADPDVEPGG